MKAKSIILFLAVIGIVGFYYNYSISSKSIEPEKCVFKTVFGEVELDSNFTYAPRENILSSVDEGLEWLKKAQHPDGGWGAGFHASQRQMNPHKVPVDPATTAMVAMALLRSGSTLDKGDYQKPLIKATDYLLKTIEKAKADGSKITELSGTQIQRKLGENIDIVMTTQFLTNLLETLDDKHPYYERVFHTVNKSVDIVQQTMDKEGKVRGAGWAGVLQSSFATNALETAESLGASVDKKVLKQSKSYQSSNYDPVSEKVETKDGAGIMLYSVSGSVRANAKEARKAKEVIKKAKKAGSLAENEKISYDNLVKAGITEDDALELETAYNIYESSKRKAQEKEVVSGFGNNGGEEFISYLQTGESLIINQDDSWHKWFDSVSANLLNIQNNDGSWNGHHCITSPVFCTATCIMILTVNNDIEQLVARGGDESDK